MMKGCLMSSRNLAKTVCLAATIWMLAGTTASAYTYPDKGAWIRNASDQIINNFPQVDAIMWFNEFKERDWRINSDPASLQAFQDSWVGLQTGAFLAGFPYPSPMDTNLITDFETMANRHQARIGWYESLDKLYPTAEINAVQARGSIPYVVFEPFDASMGDTARSGESRLDDILAGAYDDRLTSWAQAAAANGLPIEMTFGHEMNGDWFTWGYLNGNNGNTAQLYIDTFRYVVDLFDQEGATNVSWVWTINASWQDDFSMAFPGVDYVDRMGMNGFNWGGDPNDPTLLDYEKWREFEDIFGAWDPNNPNGVNNYEMLVQLGPDIPIIIGEFASATPEPATLLFLTLGSVGLIRSRRRRR